MNRNTILLLVGIVAFSCGVKENSDDISGIYVREYSVEIVNSESGAKIGARTVRDSIFIKASNEGYEILNKKWQKNDYDLEGWRNMDHADDRSFATFTGVFDRTNNLIVSESNVRLIFDQTNRSLSKGQNGPVFQKVSQTN